MSNWGILYISQIKEILDIKEGLTKKFIDMFKRNYRYAFRQNLQSVHMYDSWAVADGVITFSTQPEICIGDIIALHVKPILLCYSLKFFLLHNFTSSVIWVHERHGNFTEFTFHRGVQILVYFRVKTKDRKTKKNKALLMVWEVDITSACFKFILV